MMALPTFPPGCGHVNIEDELGVKRDANTKNRPTPRIAMFLSSMFDV